MEFDSIDALIKACETKENLLHSYFGDFSSVKFKEEIMLADKYDSCVEIENSSVNKLDSVEEINDILHLKSSENVSIIGLRMNKKLYLVLKRAPRISLTIRNVPKVIKANLFFGKTR